MNTSSPYRLYLKRLALNSQRSIASQLKQIADLLDWSVVNREASFHQITYEQASQIQSLLKLNGWSARSINRAMSAIVSIVKEGVLLGLATENQLMKLSSIKRLKQTQYQGHVLDSVQIGQLFEYLERSNDTLSIRNTAMFALLLGAGLRRSELVSAQKQDLALDKHTLFVPKGKGSKSREAFLPDWCCEHIAIWLNRRGDCDEALFNPVVRSGRVITARSLSSSSVYLLVKETLSAIGISNVSPHDLRRTYITRLLEQGVDINTVRQLAGHEDISTTVIYDKRDNKTMRAAAANLRYES